MIDSMWNPLNVGNGNSNKYDKSVSLGGGSGGNLSNYRPFILANELVAA